MRLWRRKFSAVLCALVIGAAGAIAGCGDDDDEGVVEDAGQAVEEAGQEAGQAAEEAGQEAEEAGQDIEQEVQEDDK